MWGSFGFRKRVHYVSENAGTVRLIVSRKGGGEPGSIFYSTIDGTALAGYDYEPQSGNLHFNRNQEKQEIKILVIDDDEPNTDTNAPLGAKSAPLMLRSTLQSSDSEITPLSARAAPVLAAKVEAR